MSEVGNIWYRGLSTRAAFSFLRHRFGAVLKVNAWDRLLSPPFLKGDLGGFGHLRDSLNFVLWLM